MNHQPEDPPTITRAGGSSAEGDEFDTSRVAGLSSSTRFAQIFSGFDAAFGIYNGISQERQDGKLLGNERRTVRESIKSDHYRAHLEGRSGLGIIPIMADNNVWFGAIDIDVYADLDHAELASRVARQALPLVVCRSKSGGAHIFCFASEPVPASRMQARLREVAASLGHGNSEIFPKQSKVLTDKGDLGSWFNLPYFDGVRGLRYAIRPEDGAAMEVEEFLSCAESLRQPSAWFSEPLASGNCELPQGPPCLQHLVQLGFPPGTRNQGLFNLGVYARKADPENWKHRLDEMNYRYMKPALGSEEVETIKRSLSKRSYDYRCSDQPIMSHCDRAVCRVQKFGVGVDGTGIQIQSLSKLDCDPPRYFVTLERGRVEVGIEDLLDPYRFQRIVAARLNHVPPIGKRDKWTANIDRLMQTMETIPAPEDASEEAHLWNLVEKYCTGRAKALDKAEVLIGKPWRDAGRVFFLSSALVTALERSRVKVRMAELWTLLRSHGAEYHKPEKLKGKTVRLWSVPDFEIISEGFEVPDAIAGGGGPDGAF